MWHQIRCTTTLHNNNGIPNESRTVLILPVMHCLTTFIVSSSCSIEIYCCITLGKRKVLPKGK